MKALPVYGAGDTNRGLTRSNNEDSFFVCNETVGMLPHLFIVADGIGGSRAGEVASVRAVEYFRDFVEKAGVREDIPGLFLDAMRYANELVYKLSLTDPAYEGMGTTMIAAAIVDGILYYAHIGDSRLYVLDEDGLHLLTEDHTLGNEMLNSGLLSDVELDGMDHRNVLVRWIGTNTDITPDMNSVKLSEGAIVMICSDGLSNMVGEEELSEVLRSAEQKAEKIQKLISLANKNGGRDNITIILV